MIAILLALLAATIALPAPADAQTAPIRYVAVEGSDTTDCTDPTAPCATISHALNESEGAGPPFHGPKGEIRIAGGVYEERLNLDGSVTLTGDGDVTLIGGLESYSGIVTVRGINITGGIDVAFAELLVEDATFTPRAPGGTAVRSHASAVEIRDSTFIGPFGQALLLQSEFDLVYGPGWGQGNHVENVTIIGSRIGIDLEAMQSVRIKDVTVTGAETAIVLGNHFTPEAQDFRFPAAVRSAVITGSHFEGSAAAMVIYEEPPGGLTVTSNQIIGPIHLVSDLHPWFNDALARGGFDVGPMSLNLCRNWWGNPAGPDPAIFTHEGDAASNIEVAVEPWCTNPACSAFAPPAEPSPPASQQDPKLPSYYSVPDVVGVTLQVGDETHELDPRPKDEWIEEARRHLPNLRAQEWFPDVIVEVISDPDEAHGRVHIAVPAGADLQQIIP